MVNNRMDHVIVVKTINILLSFNIDAGGYGFMKELCIAIKALLLNDSMCLDLNNFVMYFTNYIGFDSPNMSGKPIYLLYPSNQKMEAMVDRLLFPSHLD